TLSGSITLETREGGPDRPWRRVPGRGRRAGPGDRPGPPTRGAAPPAAAPVLVGAVPGRGRAAVRAPAHRRQGRLPGDVRHGRRRGDGRRGELPGGGPAPAGRRA